MPTIDTPPRGIALMLMFSDAVVESAGVALGVEKDDAERRDFRPLGWCVRGRRIEGEPGDYETADETEWILEADIGAATSTGNWRGALRDSFEDPVAIVTGDHSAQGADAADTMRSEAEPNNPFDYSTPAYQVWQDAYEGACY